MGADLVGDGKQGDKGGFRVVEESVLRLLSLWSVGEWFLMGLV